MGSIEKEMAIIARRNGGLLRPADVVEFARDKTTALHGRFTWDDTEAAKQYRLWQAREIIRVSVTVIPNTETECRTYVSLTDDRHSQGGYRSVVSVLGNSELREVMLTEALAELNVIRRKYSTLKELTTVFAAIDDVAKPKPRVDAKRKGKSRQRGALALV